MRTLLRNIGNLAGIENEGRSFFRGNEMNQLHTIQDAYLLIENQRILAFGTMGEFEGQQFDKNIDLDGKTVLPGWCDSHTHLVYAGDRTGEFVDRIRGLSYQEIAEKGGGILNSAAKLQAIDESQLFDQSAQRLEQVMALGTTAIEIKSGYGLTLEAELKMLRVIRKLKEKYDVPIAATFLAAHALPAEYKENKTAFIDQVVNKWIPKVASENLAEYIDVFCEKGYFDLTDTSRILEAGIKQGLKGKIHVNQFNSIGGVELGVKHNALSVDHLEEMSKADFKALKETDTIAVALPGCSHFLSIPYTPARKLIDQGTAVALATDYNPGSSPSGNMNFVVSEACVKMNMTPEEAINAATLNGAYAMGLEKEVGSIAKGKLANLIVLENNATLNSIPYSFGRSVIEEVWVNGRKI